MPDWKLKAVLMGVMSAMPEGHRLNYLLQRHVTRQLPESPDGFRERVEKAAAHLESFTRHGGITSNATAFEFGAGWDMVGPLAMAAAGVHRQVIVDIWRLARPELVRDTIRRLRLPEPQGASASELLEAFGIAYQAPGDARATGLPDSSVDLATSTSTLEHIPLDDIRLILRECRRILRPDGLLSFRINYEDHYSFFDGSIGRYNFLRYPAATWRRFNPALHFQNRLRHRDYLGLFEAAGYDLLEDEHPAPDPENLGAVHQEFGSYLPEELAIPRATLVYRPGPAAT